MLILDATAGSRTIWYQKHHPLVTFMDKRNEIIRLDNGKVRNKRKLEIKPDIIADWTKELPFPENHFDMVVFDPPHIIRPTNELNSILKKKYGCFSKDTYKSELRIGARELFRILKEDGIFILKWCDIDVPVDDIIPLFPYKPMFGTRTGQRNNTHWILFLKHRLNEDIVRFSQDKEITDNPVNCSPCRNKTEHKSTSENSNKTDIAGVDF